MSTRRGVIVGLSVLAFVGVAFLMYLAKSSAQVFTMNSASTTCANEAKAHPNDRTAMDRCLKAAGVLVEDSPPPGTRTSAGTHTPAPSDPYTACLNSAAVKKHAPKSLSWATALSSCLNDAGETAVLTMHRNPATGDIDYGVSH